jgi:polygalacturonase
LAACLKIATGQNATSPAIADQTPGRALGPARAYEVTKYGATGDGKTVDTLAINKAIDAAAADGGGTVYFPAGTYLCFSIHLKSNIALYLDHGATILAADTPPDGGGYDAPEPNPFDKYQRISALTRCRA